MIYNEKIIKIMVGLCGNLWVLLHKLLKYKKKSIIIIKLLIYNGIIIESLAQSSQDVLKWLDLYQIM